MAASIAAFRCLKVSMPIKRRRTSAMACWKSRCPRRSVSNVGVRSRSNRREPRISRIFTKVLVFIRVIRGCFQQNRLGKVLAQGIVSFGSGSRSPRLSLRLARYKAAEEDNEMKFQDRTEAGWWLAQKLTAYQNRPDVLVLALPRGGVPVAYEVAQALNAPLDVFLVRKLGVPGHEELAMGAIATGGVRVLNQRVLREARIPPSDVEAVAADEERELARRERAY